jgi:lysozyme family protein
MAYLFAALRGEYAALWRQMIADDRRSGEFLTTVRRMNAGMASYRAVEEITGVPAAVVAVIHEREGAGNFTTHLHNGDPLRERTVHVPAGRPLAGRLPMADDLGLPRGRRLRSSRRSRGCGRRRRRGRPYPAPVCRD